MRAKFKGILTLLLAFVVQLSFAQEKTVTGTVIDKDGLPIPGVNVIIKNTTTGTQTDFDGNFAIKVSNSDVLVFSYQGMKKVEMSVGSKITMNISMIDDVEALEEVVVVGYNSVVTKRANTVVSKVSAETIRDRPNASVIQTLQGQVAGLNIQTSTGQPGANSLIRIRGLGSINGNTEPLIIIDGAPVDEDNFRSLNPNDIENVNVLKDAAGTSLYGNRGANGVIIITTKKAKFNSNLDISYQAMTGFSEIVDPDYNLFDSRGLLALENQRNVGIGTTLTQEEIQSFDVNTDWADVFFRTGVTNSHNLTLSHGSENVSQVTTLGYFEQEGILVNSGLQRFSFRNNLNGKSNDGKFTYNSNITMNFSRNADPGSVGTGAVNQNFILGAYQSVPYLSPADYTTSDITGILRNTPLFLLDKQIYNTRETDEIKIIGTLAGRYQITDQIHARMQFSIDYADATGINSQNPLSFNSNFFLNNDEEFGGFETRSSTRDITFNNLINIGWMNNYDKHSITVNGYMEYVKSHLESFSFVQNGIVNNFYSPGSGQGYVLDLPNDDYYVPDVSTGESEYGLFSVFGQIDYDYDDKYGLGFTLRNDSSSRFVGDNKSDIFWSIAGRWNISEESFMEDSFLDLLKLRVSYGTNGNDRITGGYYGGLSLTQSLFNVGSSYGDQQGIVFAGISNRDIRWEEVSTFNVGLDFAMLKNRLQGSVDYYIKDTNDLFNFFFIPQSIYAQSSVSGNIGDLRNTGVDLDLSYQVVQPKSYGDFGFRVNVVGNYNENEVLNVNTENGIIDGTNTVIAEGRAINEFYMVPYVGVNPSNGNLLFLDINDNLTEAPTLDDRRFTGKDFIPDFQGGFGFNVEYKGFYLDTQWNYTVGIDRLDFDLSGYLDPQNIGIFNVSRDLLRAWTPTNRVTDIPSLEAGNLNVGGGFTDRFLQESDFLRLRFVGFGYRFPKTLIDNTFLTGGSIFVNGENLLTFTKWRGADPESADASAQSEYPTPRIISVGLSLNF